MMMIAIVRTSGFVIKNTFDMVWVIFWHQVEGAVAIIMVSITAFRSLLGIQALKVREKKRMERSWFLHRPRLLARYFKKDTSDESESQQLPSIPRATLTGMRTFINGNGIWDEPKAMEMTHKSEKDWLRTTSHEPQEIKVIHQVSVELDILEGAKIARAAGFVWRYVAGQIVTCSVEKSQVQKLYWLFLYLSVLLSSFWFWELWGVIFRIWGSKVKRGQNG